MLREMFETEKVKSQQFQVLFLRNNATQEVEVQEVKQVNFLEVQDHLEHGESVFITSKRSQKLNPPKRKKMAGRVAKTRMVEAYYLDHV